MKQKLIQLATIGITIASLLLFSSTITMANTSCQPIYGGGETCVSSGNIQITKLVQNPQSGVFVNNLGINDPKYAAGQDVNFRLTISNIGSTTFSQVNVTDIFPQYLTFVSGPGNFNSNNKTLSFTINSLQAGASQVFNIVGQVVDPSQLPSGTSVECVINQAQVQTNDSETAQSNAQFCIQHTAVNQVENVPPISTTPPTGPEELPLLMLIPSALTGIVLIRYSLKNKLSNLLKKTSYEMSSR